MFTGSDGSIWRSKCTITTAAVTCLKLSPQGYCSNDPHEPTAEWDVSSVTDMDAVFIDAISFNGDILKWDVSSVKDMSHMFEGASSFNGDLSK